MSDSVTAAQNLIVQAATHIAEGASPRAVHRRLVTAGVPDTAASEIVHAASCLKRAAVRKSGLRALIAGAAAIAIGGIGTAVSYAVAEPGGAYLVTTGAFFVGAVMILRGIARLITG